MAILMSTSAGHELRNQTSDRETRGQSRRFDSRRLHDKRILAIAADHEIRERLARRMQLRADAAAAQTQILERHVAQQPPRRLDEGVDRQAIGFVIIFARLEARGGAEPYLARGRFDEMD